MQILKKIDDLMSQRDILRCAIELAAYRKATKAANRFVGPMPKGYVLPKKPHLKLQLQAAQRQDYGTMGQVQQPV
jgi:hypothetical protein